MIIYKELQMQKQLRILDEQLTSNNLVRVSQANLKNDKSLFKAISLSIFYTEDHFDEVIRLMKICVFCCSRGEQKNNPFPTAFSRAKFVSNFSENEQLLRMYFEKPDLNCYSQDNLEIASVTFGKRVILYTISSDGYLQEQLVTSCSGKKTEPPIMLAKVFNKYFCVQKQSTRSIITFIKQNIINHVKESLSQLLNSENKIHYPQIVRRPHKKSLSDCGDLNLNFEEQMMGKNYYDGSENGYHEMQRMGLSRNHSYKHNSMEEYYYQHNNNYLYQDPNTALIGLPENPRFERQNSTLPPNKRYSGRLKFFDQNGNYGFIVVDGINCDLFVHYDDLSKAGVTKDRLINIRNSEEMRFAFTCLQYDGKYKKSKKAVDLMPLVNQY